MKLHLIRALVAAAAICLAAEDSHAGLLYDVTLDTSLLAANSGQGTFYFDFELSGDGTGNNTATISNFRVTSGSVTSGSQGSVDGSVSPTVDFSVPSTVLVLTDSATNPLVDFNQAFLPGSQLSFTLDLTTNVNTPEITTPDQFIFQVASDVSPSFDNNTNANASFTSVLTMNISSPTVTHSAQPTVDSVGGQLGLPVNGNVIFTPAAEVSQVPEPATLGMMGLGLLGLLFQSRRRHCRLSLRESSVTLAE